MSESPYKPPETSSEPVGDASRQEARKVATYQRYVLFALLASIIINVVAIAAGQQSQIVSLAILFIALAIGIFSMVSIFLLARELMGTGIAVLCAVLMFIPCISLITLLVVNQKATSHLKQKGIKVGLMGANPNSI